jgi:tetratricopeptide (TPR) repeat protein
MIRLSGHFSPRAIACLSSVGIAVILAAITWAVFGQTTGFEFINYDDNETVYENREVAKGLTLDGFLFAFTHSQVGHWDPLTTLSHMLACDIFRMNAGGHHLVNVLLHALAAFLLFLVLWDSTGEMWRSAVVAAIFAIHPLRVESVAWVTERKDVLSGVFFMVTLGAYVRYARAPSLGRYVSVVLVFALGLLSKSMLVTIPLVLIVLDYWPLRRFGGAASASATTASSGSGYMAPGLRHLLREKLPLLGMAIIFSIIQVISASEGLLDTTRLPMTTRIENALVAYTTYIGQMFLPINLAVFYPHLESAIEGWKIGLSIAVLAGISAVVIACRKERPYLVVGWLWFLGMLFPVIGLIQSGELARADRYTYLPQIGLYLLFTWLVSDLLSVFRYRTILAGGLALASVTALAIGAKNQTATWRDSETLWRHALACTVGNYVAHDNLGSELSRQGRISEAISHHRQSIDINPRYYRAASNLGILLLDLGQTREAIFWLEKAITINADYAIGHINLGSALLAIDDFDGAIMHYQRALAIAPRNPVAEANLGLAYSRSGRIANAIDRYERALEWDPDYVKAHANLGSALLQEGRAREAVAHLERALALAPEFSIVENQLAWIRATSSLSDVRDVSTAIRLAEHANLLAKSGQPIFLRTLAIAYGEAGRYSEAVATARRALPLAEARSDTRLVEALHGDIERLETGTPLYPDH